MDQPLIHFEGLELFNLLNKYNRYLYWDFSINDHAFTDIPAFISGIVRTTLSEPNVQHPHILGVAHSMGGAIALRYLQHYQNNVRQR
mgnify:CR=1 FL=1